MTSPAPIESTVQAVPSPFGAGPRESAARRSAIGEAIASRVPAGLLALCTGVVLLLAAWLEPAAEGVGTHTALGLPRCGWIATADLPCPTCGMTTAFAHAADGRMIRAFTTQPAGFVLAVITAMAFVASLYSTLTAQSIWPLLAPLMRPAMWGLGGAVVVGGWVWKILLHRGYI